MTPPVQEKSQRNVKFAHCSMQFSDTRRQMKHDVDKVVGKGYDIITGTEAGNNPLRELFRDAAKREGYRFHQARSVFVLVSRDLIKGDWETGYVPVIESHEGIGKHSDRGLAWVSFNTKDLGPIAVAAGHYLTKGRSPGQSPGGINLRLNREMGGAIGEWAARMGKGVGLAFYGGDQNIPDRGRDTFFGSPMTSSWDELGKWPNTGHGNIDVIASYDRDGRVKAKRARAFSDKSFFLHTDHLLIETVFQIKTV